MKSYFEDRDGDWVIRFDEQGRTVSSTFLFRMCHPSSTLRTKPSLLGSSRRVRSRRSTAWCACPQNAEPVSPSRCLQLHLDQIATKVTPRRPRHSHSRLSRLTW